MSKKVEARNEVIKECNRMAEKLENQYGVESFSLEDFVPVGASAEDLLKTSFRVFGKNDRLVDFNQLCEEYFSINKRDFSVVPLLSKSYFSTGDVIRCKGVAKKFFDFLSEEQKLEIIEILGNLGEWIYVEEYIKKLDVKKLSKGGVTKLFLLNKRLERSDTGSALIDTNVLCLNLKDDVRKRSIVKNIYSNVGVDVNIQEAIRGSYLDESEIQRINPNGKFWKQLGAVGCFLSHIEAIKKVASGNAEYSMIIEDDGLPYYRFGDEEIESAIKGNDVVFINNRMSSLVCEHVSCEGMTTVVERLSMLPDIRKGWGGDGYVISKIGAQKLLENFSVDKIIGHFDGQLGSYCVEKNTSVGKKNKALNIAEVFGKKFKGSNVLVGKTLNFPMVHTVNFSVSSRNIVNQMT